MGCGAAKIRARLQRVVLGVCTGRAAQCCPQEPCLLCLPREGSSSAAAEEEVEQSLVISAAGQQSGSRGFPSTGGRSWREQAGAGRGAPLAGARVRTSLPAAQPQPRTRGQKAACRGATRCLHLLLQLRGAWDGHFTFSQRGLDFCTARNMFPGRQLQSLLRSDRFKLRFVRQHPKV